MREVVSTRHAPNAIGPYAQAVPMKKVFAGLTLARPPPKYRTESNGRQSESKFPVRFRSTSNPRKLDGRGTWNGSLEPGRGSRNHSSPLHYCPLACHRSASSGVGRGFIAMSEEQDD